MSKRMRMTTDTELLNWWIEKRPLFLRVILKDYDGITDRDMERYLTDIKYRIETGSDEGLSGGYFLDADDLDEFKGCVVGQLAPALSEQMLANKH